LDALVQKLDHDSNTSRGETTMSNTAKNTGNPKTVAEAVAAAKDAKNDATVPAQAKEPQDGVKTETKSEGQTETKSEGQTDAKKSVVQRAKAVAEKLKENRGLMAGLGFAAGFVSAIVVSKRRSAAGIQTDDGDVVADTEIHTVGEDDTTPDES
jgi:hypothetical protein